MGCGCCKGSKVQDKPPGEREREAREKRRQEFLERQEREERERREKAQREAEELAKKEAEEKAKKEAEEKAKKDAEAKARQEAEEKAKREAEEKGDSDEEEEEEEEEESEEEEPPEDPKRARQRQAAQELLRSTESSLCRLYWAYLRRAPREGRSRRRKERGRAKLASKLIATETAHLRLRFTTLADFAAASAAARRVREGQLAGCEAILGQTERGLQRAALRRLGVYVRWRRQQRRKCCAADRMAARTHADLLRRYFAKQVELVRIRRRHKRNFAAADVCARRTTQGLLRRYWAIWDDFRAARGSEARKKQELRQQRMRLLNGTADGLCKRTEHGFRVLAWRRLERLIERKRRRQRSAETLLSATQQGSRKVLLTRGMQRLALWRDHCRRQRGRRDAAFAMAQRCDRALRAMCWGVLEELERRRRERKRRQKEMSVLLGGQSDKARRHYAFTQLRGNVQRCKQIRRKRARLEVMESMMRSKARGLQRLYLLKADAWAREQMALAARRARALSSVEPLLMGQKRGVRLMCMRRLRVYAEATRGHREANELRQKQIEHTLMRTTAKGLKKASLLAWHDLARKIGHARKLSETLFGATKLGLQRRYYSALQERVGTRRRSRLEREIMQIRRLCRTFKMYKTVGLPSEGPLLQANDGCQWAAGGERVGVTCELALWVDGSARGCISRISYDPERRWLFCNPLTAADEAERGEGKLTVPGSEAVAPMYGFALPAEHEEKIVAAVAAAADKCSVPHSGLLAPPPDAAFSQQWRDALRQDPTLRLGAPIRVGRARRGWEQERAPNAATAADWATTRNDASLAEEERLIEEFAAAAGDAWRPAAGSPGSAARSRHGAAASPPRSLFSAASAAHALGPPPHAAGGPLLPVPALEPAEGQPRRTRRRAGSGRRRRGSGR